MEYAFELYPRLARMKWVQAVTCHFNPNSDLGDDEMA